MVNASYLVDRKIKLKDGLYVKVVAVKMNKDGVFFRGGGKSRRILRNYVSARYGWIMFFFYFFHRLKQSHLFPQII